MEKNIRSFSSFDEAVDYYYSYYRENGYPNYSRQSYDAGKELEKVRKAKDVFSGDVATQSMIGCGYLWSFFPHWVDVSTWNSQSVSELWEDDRKLRKLMEKTVTWCIRHEKGRMSENRVRQLAKVYLAKQSPSNFRPTVAKSLFERYGNQGAIYDPCGGWGGRMFGFFASDCTEYVCCEPSTKTAIGLLQIADEYDSIHKMVEVHQCCQEDYAPARNHFDMVFTSPPYFDCERYSDEETQSYIRYPTIEEWNEGFLFKLISNAYSALKDGGYFVLNIANTKTAPELEMQSQKYANEVGFKLQETLKLSLSSISGKGIKYEPMFVFRR